jgi:hypothetical protein
MVWNANDAPVEGFTSFLWMIFCSVLIRLGLNVEFYSQFAGVLSGLVTLFVTYRFGRDIFGFRPFVAVLPCMMLAAAGPFATWATSGMEMSAFGAALILSVYLVCRFLLERQQPYLIAACLSLLATTLIRPEGLLIVALSSAALLFDSREVRERLRNLGLVALVFGLPFLVYFVWRYQHFGFPLPNTFYAKTGGGIEQVVRGLKYSGLFFLHFIAPFTPVIALWIWDRGGIEKERGKQIGIAFSTVLLLSYGAYIVAVGGDYMAMYRFFMPILPFFHLLIGVAAEPLLAEQALRRRVVTAGLLLAAIGAAFIQSTPLEIRIFRLPDFMLGTYRGVLHERWSVNRNWAIGRFLHERMKAGDSVSLFGIGVMAYELKDFPVRSLVALVDPQMAHMKVDDLGTGFAGHEKVDILRVLETKPTLVLFDINVYENTTAPSDLVVALGAALEDPSVQKILAEQYEPATEWLDDPLNDEGGYLRYYKRVSGKQGHGAAPTGP